MKSPLFSTYRQGENRVTSSMLAVFERLDMAVLEALLGAASGEAALPFVKFVNQAVGSGSAETYSGEELIERTCRPVSQASAKRPFSVR
jgi:hypothetical protein